MRSSSPSEAGSASEDAGEPIAKWLKNVPLRIVATDLPPRIPGPHPIHRKCRENLLKNRHHSPMRILWQHLDLH